MALVTVSLAAVGLAASTLLVTASSQGGVTEPEPDMVVCRDVIDLQQRELPAGSRCVPRAEVAVSPSP